VLFKIHLNIIRENLKDDSKVVHMHTMKALMGSGGVAPLILNLVISGGEWSASGPLRLTLRVSAPDTN
jgi:hypothetical protein